MIDKDLLRLLGGNKKYIAFCVGLMVLGLFANVGITASLCWAIALAVRYNGGAGVFLAPAGLCLYRDWRFAMPPLALSGI